MLKNMKISIRLGLAFGFLAFLCALSGAIGWRQLGVVNHNLERIVSDSNVKTALAQSVSTEIRIGMDSILTTMVIQDKEAIDAALKRGLSAQQRFFKQREELRRITTDPEGRSLVDAFFEANDKKAQPDFGRFIQLAQEGKREEAGAWLVAKAAPSMQELQDSITKFIEFQTRRNIALHDQSKQDFENAKWLLLSSVLASLVFGTFAGVGVTHSLTQALGAEPSELGNVTDQVANGDLTTPLRIRTGDTSSVMAAMHRMQTSLTKVVSVVQQGSETVSTASAEIAQANNDLSARTESQASALEETAASMEELSSTVKQNADNARQANQLAQNASTVAIRGREVVSQVVATMRGINDSSNRISDIISVIDGIAFQTNILALNAAVEAARAGEQGRGFAVVASEVRSLAGRSADAAKEIKALITASVERVEQGTVQADQAGATMMEIVDSIRRVTDIVGEISAASTEQSQGVAQIGEAIQQMDHATQQNAALVEEMAAATSSLKHQAQDLVSSIAVFKSVNSIDSTGYEIACNGMS